MSGPGLLDLLRRDQRKATEMVAGASAGETQAVADQEGSALRRRPLQPADAGHLFSQWDRSEGERMRARFTGNGTLVLGESDIEVEAQDLGIDEASGKRKVAVKQGEGWSTFLANDLPDGSIELPIGGGSQFGGDHRQAWMLPGMAAKMIGDTVDFVTPFADPARAMGVQAKGEEWINRGVAAMSPEQQADLALAAFGPGKQLMAGYSGLASLPLSMGGAWGIHKLAPRLSAGRLAPSEATAQGIMGGAMVGGEAHGELARQGKDALTGGLLAGLGGALTERQVPGLARFRVLAPGREAAAEVLQESSIKTDVSMHGGHAGEIDDILAAAMAGYGVGMLFARNPSLQKRVEQMLNVLPEEEVDEALRRAEDGKPPPAPQPGPIEDGPLAGADTSHPDFGRPPTGPPAREGVDPGESQVYLGGRVGTRLDYPPGVDPALVRSAVRDRIMAKHIGALDLDDRQQAVAQVDELLGIALNFMLMTPNEYADLEPVFIQRMGQVEGVARHRLYAQLATDYTQFHQDILHEGVPEGTDNPLARGEEYERRLDERVGEDEMGDYLGGRTVPPEHPVMGDLSMVSRLKQLAGVLHQQMAQDPRWDGFRSKGDGEEMRKFAEVAVRGMAIEEEEFQRMDWEALEERFGKPLPLSRDLQLGAWKANLREHTRMAGRLFGTLDREPIDYRDVPPAGPYAQEEMVHKGLLDEGAEEAATKEAGDWARDVEGQMVRGALDELDEVDKDKDGKVTGKRQSVARVAMPLLPRVTEALGKRPGHRSPGTVKGDLETLQAQASMAVSAYREMAEEIGREQEYAGSRAWRDLVRAGARGEVERGAVERLVDGKAHMLRSVGALVTKATEMAATHQLSEEAEADPDRRAALNAMIRNRMDSVGPSTAYAEIIANYFPEVMATVEDAIDLTMRDSDRYSDVRPVLKAMVSEALKSLSAEEAERKPTAEIPSRPEERKDDTPEPAPGQATAEGHDPGGARPDEPAGQPGPGEGTEVLDVPGEPGDTAAEPGGEPGGGRPETDGEPDGEAQDHGEEAGDGAGDAGPESGRESDGDRDGVGGEASDGGAVPDEAGVDGSDGSDSVDDGGTGGVDQGEPAAGTGDEPAAAADGQRPGEGAEGAAVSPPDTRIPLADSDKVFEGGVDASEVDVSLGALKPTDVDVQAKPDPLQMKTMAMSRNPIRGEEGVAETGTLLITVRGTFLDAKTRARYSKRKGEDGKEFYIVDELLINGNPAADPGELRHETLRGLEELVEREVAAALNEDFAGRIKEADEQSGTDGAPEGKAEEKGEVAEGEKGDATPQAAPVEGEYTSDDIELMAEDGDVFVPAKHGVTFDISIRGEVRKGYRGSMGFAEKDGEREYHVNWIKIHNKYIDEKKEIPHGPWSSLRQPIKDAIVKHLNRNPMPAETPAPTQDGDKPAPVGPDTPRPAPQQDDGKAIRDLELGNRPLTQEDITLVNADGHKFLEQDVKESGIFHLYIRDFHGREQKIDNRTFGTVVFEGKDALNSDFVMRNLHIEGRQMKAVRENPVIAADFATVNELIREKIAQEINDLLGLKETAGEEATGGKQEREDGDKASGETAEFTWRDVRLYDLKDNANITNVGFSNRRSTYFRAEISKPGTFDIIPGLNYKYSGKIFYDKARPPREKLSIEFIEFHHPKTVRLETPDTLSNGKYMAAAVANIIAKHLNANRKELLGEGVGTKPGPGTEGTAGQAEEDGGTEGPWTVDDVELKDYADSEPKFEPDKIQKLYIHIKGMVQNLKKFFAAVVEDEGEYTVGKMELDGEDHTKRWNTITMFDTGAVIREIKQYVVDWLNKRGFKKSPDGAESPPTPQEEEEGHRIPPKPYDRPQIVNHGISVNELDKSLGPVGEHDIFLVDSDEQDWTPPPKNTDNVAFLQVRDQMLDARSKVLIDSRIMSFVLHQMTIEDNEVYKEDVESGPDHFWDKDETKKMESFIKSWVAQELNEMMGFTLDEVKEAARLGRKPAYKRNADLYGLDPDELEKTTFKFHNKHHYKNIAREWKMTLFEAGREGVNPFVAQGVDEVVEESNRTTTAPNEGTMIWQTLSFAGNRLEVENMVNGKVETDNAAILEKLVTQTFIKWLRAPEGQKVDAPKVLHPNVDVPRGMFNQPFLRQHFKPPVGPKEVMSYAHAIGVYIDGDMTVTLQQRIPGFSNTSLLIKVDKKEVAQGGFHEVDYGESDDKDKLYDVHISVGEGKIMSFEGYDHQLKGIGPVGFEEYIKAENKKDLREELASRFGDTMELAVAVPRWTKEKQEMVDFARNKKDAVTRAHVTLADPDEVDGEEMLAEIATKFHEDLIIEEGMVLEARWDGRHTDKTWKIQFAIGGRDINLRALVWNQPKGSPTDKEDKVRDGRISHFQMKVHGHDWGDVAFNALWYKLGSGHAQRFYSTPGVPEQVLAEAALLAKELLTRPWNSKESPYRSIIEAGVDSRVSDPYLPEEDEENSGEGEDSADGQTAPGAEDSSPPVPTIPMAEEIQSERHWYQYIVTFADAIMEMFAIHNAEVADNPEITRGIAQTLDPVEKGSFTLLDMIRNRQIPDWGTDDMYQFNSNLKYVGEKFAQDRYNEHRAYDHQMQLGLMMHRLGNWGMERSLKAMKGEISGVTPGFRLPEPFNTDGTERTTSPGPTEGTLHDDVPQEREVDPRQSPALDPAPDTTITSDEDWYRVTRQNHWELRAVVMAQFPDVAEEDLATTMVLNAIARGRQFNWNSQPIALMISQYNAVYDDFINRPKEVNKMPLWEQMAYLSKALADYAVRRAGQVKFGEEDIGGEEAMPGTSLQGPTQQEAPQEEAKPAYTPPPDVDIDNDDGSTIDEIEGEIESDAEWYRLFRRNYKHYLAAYKLWEDMVEEGQAENPPEVDENGDPIEDDEPDPEGPDDDGDWHNMWLNSDAVDMTTEIGEGRVFDTFDYQENSDWATLQYHMNQVGSHFLSWMSKNWMDDTMWRLKIAPHMKKIAKYIEDRNGDREGPVDLSSIPPLGEEERQAEERQETGASLTQEPRTDLLFWQVLYANIDDIARLAKHYTDVIIKGDHQGEKTGLKAITNGARGMIERLQGLEVDQREILGWKQADVGFLVSGLQTIGAAHKDGKVDGINGYKQTPKDREVGTTMFWLGVYGERRRKEKHAWSDPDDPLAIDPTIEIAGWVPPFGEPGPSPEAMTPITEPYSPYLRREPGSALHWWQFFFHNAVSILILVDKFRNFDRKTEQEDNLIWINLAAYFALKNRVDDAKGNRTMYPWSEAELHEIGSIIRIVGEFYLNGDMQTHFKYEPTSKEMDVARTMKHLGAYVENAYHKTREGGLTGRAPVAPFQEGGPEYPGLVGKETAQQPQPQPQPQEEAEEDESGSHHPDEDLIDPETDDGGKLEIPLGDIQDDETFYGILRNNANQFIAVMRYLHNLDWHDSNSYNESILALRQVRDGKVILFHSDQMKNLEKDFRQIGFMSTNDNRMQSKYLKAVGAVMMMMAHYIDRRLLDDDIDPDSLPPYKPPAREPRKAKPKEKPTPVGQPVDSDLVNYVQERLKHFLPDLQDAFESLPDEAEERDPRGYMLMGGWINKLANGEIPGMDNEVLPLFRGLLDWMANKSGMLEEDQEGREEINEFVGQLDRVLNKTMKRTIRQSKAVRWIANKIQTFKSRFTKDKDEPVESPQLQSLSASMDFGDLGRAKPGAKRRRRPGLAGRPPEQELDEPSVPGETANETRAKEAIERLKQLPGYGEARMTKQGKIGMVFDDAPYMDAKTMVDDMNKWNGVQAGVNMARAPEGEAVSYMQGMFVLFPPAMVDDVINKMNSHLEENQKKHPATEAPVEEWQPKRLDLPDTADGAEIWPGVNMEAIPGGFIVKIPVRYLAEKDIPRPVMQRATVTVGPQGIYWIVRLGQMRKEVRDRFVEELMDALDKAKEENPNAFIDPIPDEEDILAVPHQISLTGDILEGYQPRPGVKPPQRNRSLDDLLVHDPNMTLWELTETGKKISETGWKDAAQKLYDSMRERGASDLVGFKLNGLMDWSLTAIGDTSNEPIDVGDNARNVSYALAAIARTMRRVINNDPELVGFYEERFNPNSLRLVVNRMSALMKRVEHRARLGEGAFQDMVPSLEATAIVSWFLGGKGVTLVNDGGGQVDAMARNVVSTVLETKDHGVRQSIWPAARGPAREFLQRDGKHQLDYGEALRMLHMTPDQVQGMFTNMAFIHDPKDFSAVLNKSLGAMQEGLGNLAILIPTEHRARAAQVIDKFNEGRKSGFHIAAWLRDPGEEADWSFIGGGRNVDLLLINHQRMTGDLAQRQRELGWAVLGWNAAREEFENQAQNHEVIALAAEADRLRLRRKDAEGKQKEALDNLLKENAGKRREVSARLKAMLVAREQEMDNITKDLKTIKRDTLFTPEGDYDLGMFADRLANQNWAHRRHTGNHIDGVANMILEGLAQEEGGVVLETTRTMSALEELVPDEMRRFVPKALLTLQKRGHVRLEGDMQVAKLTGKGLAVVRASEGLLPINIPGGIGVYNRPQANMLMDQAWAMLEDIADDIPAEYRRSREYAEWIVMRLGQTTGLKQSEAIFDRYRHSVVNRLSDFIEIIAWADPVETKEGGLVYGFRNDEDFVRYLPSWDLSMYATKADLASNYANLAWLFPRILLTSNMEYKVATGGGNLSPEGIRRLLGRGKVTIGRLDIVSSVLEDGRLDDFLDRTGRREAFGISNETPEGSLTPEAYQQRAKYLAPQMQKIASLKAKMDDGIPIGTSDQERLVSAAMRLYRDSDPQNTFNKLQELGLGKVDRQNDTFTFEASLIHNYIDIPLMTDLVHHYNEKYQPLEGRSPLTVEDADRQSMYYLLADDETARGDSPTRPLKIMKAKEIIEGAEILSDMIFTQAYPILRNPFEMRTVLRELVVERSLQEHAAMKERHPDPRVRDNELTQLMADNLFRALGIADRDPKVKYEELARKFAGGQQSEYIGGSRDTFTFWATPRGDIGMGQSAERELSERYDRQMHEKNLDAFLQNITELRYPNDGPGRSSIRGMLWNVDNTALEDFAAEGAGAENRIARMIEEGRDASSIIRYLYGEFDRRAIEPVLTDYMASKKVYQSQRRELLAFGRILQTIENIEDVYNQGRAASDRLLVGGTLGDTLGNEKGTRSAAEMRAGHLKPGRRMRIVITKGFDGTLGSYSPTTNTLTLAEAQPQGALMHEMAHAMSLGLQQTPEGRRWLLTFQMLLAVRFHPNDFVEAIRRRHNIPEPRRDANGNLIATTGTKTAADIYFKLSTALEKFSASSPTLDDEAVNDYLKIMEFDQTRFLEMTQLQEIASAKLSGRDGLRALTNLRENHPRFRFMQGQEDFSSFETLLETPPRYLMQLEELFARFNEFYGGHFNHRMGRSDELMVDNSIGVPGANFAARLGTKSVELRANYPGDPRDIDNLMFTAKLFFNNIIWNGGWQLRDPEYHPFNMALGSLTPADMRNMAALLKEEGYAIARAAGMSHSDIDNMRAGKIEIAEGLSKELLPGTVPPPPQPSEVARLIEREVLPTWAVRLDQVYTDERPMVEHPDTLIVKTSSGSEDHVNRMAKISGALTTSVTTKSNIEQEDELKRIGVGKRMEPSSAQFMVAVGNAYATGSRIVRRGLSKGLPVYKKGKEKGKKDDEKREGEEKITSRVTENSMKWASNWMRERIPEMTLAQAEDEELRKIVEATPADMEELPRLYTGAENPIHYKRGMGQDDAGQDIVSEKNMEADRVYITERQARLVAMATGSGKTFVADATIEHFFAATDTNFRTVLFHTVNQNLISNLSRDMEKRGSPTMSFIGKLLVQRLYATHALMQEIAEGKADKSIIDQIPMLDGVIDPNDTAALVKNTVEWVLDYNKIQEADIKDILRWMVGEGHGIESSFDENDDIISPLAPFNKGLDKDSPKREWDKAFSPEEGNAWQRHHQREYNSTLIDGEVTEDTIRLQNEIATQATMAEQILGNYEFAPRDWSEESAVFPVVAVTHANVPHYKLRRGDIITLRIKPNQAKTEDEFRHALINPKKGERVNLKPKRVMVLTYGDLQSRQLAMESTLLPSLENYDGLIFFDESHSIRNTYTTKRHGLYRYRTRAADGTLSGWAPVSAHPTGVRADNEIWDAQGSTQRRYVFDSSNRRDMWVAGVNDMAPNARVVFMSATPAKEMNDMPAYKRASGAGYRTTMTKEGVLQLDVAPSGRDIDHMQKVAKGFESDDEMTAVIRSMVQDDLAVSIDLQTPTEIDLVDWQMTEDENRDYFAIQDLQREYLNKYWAELGRATLGPLNYRNLGGENFVEIVIPGVDQDGDVFLMRPVEVLQMLQPTMSSKDAGHFLKMGKAMLAGMKNKRAIDDMERLMKSGVEEDKLIAAAKVLLQYEEQHWPAFEERIKLYEEGKIPLSELTKFTPLLHYTEQLMPTNGIPDTTPAGTLRTARVGQDTLNDIQSGMVNINSLGEGYEDVPARFKLIKYTSVGANNVKRKKSSELLDMRDKMVRELHEKLKKDFAHVPIDPLPGELIKRFGTRIPNPVDPTKSKAKARQRDNWDIYTNFRGGATMPLGKWIWTADDGMTINYMKFDETTDRFAAMDAFQGAHEESGYDRFWHEDTTDEEKRAILKRMDKEWESKDGPPRWLLISASTGGVGLDFHNTDGFQRYLFTIDHDYSPENTKQLMGRINRTGQLSVGVIKAFYFDNNIMDERIMINVAKGLTAIEAMASGDARSVSGTFAELLSRENIKAERTAMRAATYIFERMSYILNNKTLAEMYGLEKYNDIVEQSGRDRAMRQFAIDMGFWNEYFDQAGPSSQRPYFQSSQLTGFEQLLNRLSKVPRKTAEGLQRLIRLQESKIIFQESSARRIPKQNEMDSAKSELHASIELGELYGHPTGLLFRTYDIPQEGVSLQRLQTYGQFHQTAIMFKTDKGEEPGIVLTTDVMGRQMTRAAVDRSNPERPVREERRIVQIVRGNKVDDVDYTRFEEEYLTPDPNYTGYTRMLENALLIDVVDSLANMFNEEHGTDIQIMYSPYKTRSLVDQSDFSSPLFFVKGMKDTAMANKFIEFARDYAGTAEARKEGAFQPKLPTDKFVKAALKRVRGELDSVLEASANAGGNIDLLRQVEYAEVDFFNSLAATHKQINTFDHNTQEKMRSELKRMFMHKNFAKAPEWNRGKPFNFLMEVPRGHSLPVKQKETDMNTAFDSLEEHSMALSKAWAKLYDRLDKTYGELSRAAEMALLSRRGGDPLLRWYLRIKQVKEDDSHIHDIEQTDVKVKMGHPLDTLAIEEYMRDFGTGEDELFSRGRENDDASDKTSRLAHRAENFHSPIRSGNKARMGNKYITQSLKNQELMAELALPNYFASRTFAENVFRHAEEENDALVFSDWRGMDDRVRNKIRNAYADHNRQMHVPLQLIGRRIVELEEAMEHWDENYAGDIAVDDPTAPGGKRMYRLIRMMLIALTSPAPQGAIRRLFESVGFLSDPHIASGSRRPYQNIGSPTIKAGIYQVAVRSMPDENGINRLSNVLPTVALGQTIKGLKMMTTDTASDPNLPHIFAGLNKGNKVVQFSNGMMLFPRRMVDEVERFDNNGSYRIFGQTFGMSEEARAKYLKKEGSSALIERGNEIIGLPESGDVYGFQDVYLYAGDINAEAMADYGVAPSDSGFYEITNFGILTKLLAESGMVPPEPHPWRLRQILMNNPDEMALYDAAAEEALVESAKEAE